MFGLELKYNLTGLTTEKKLLLALQILQAEMMPPFLAALGRSKTLVVGRLVGWSVSCSVGRWANFVQNVMKHKFK